MTSVDRRRAEPKQNRLIPVSALTASGPVSRNQWQESYRRRLIATDTIVVLGSVALGHIIRLGGDSALIGTADTSWAFVNYAFVSTVLALAWVSLLAIFRSRSSRIVGSGVEEYQRIISATMRLFGFVAMVALFFRLEIARGYLAIALPVGLVGLLLSRHLWRKWLTARQEAGEFGTSVLVIGSRAAASEMTAAFERDTSSGYRVVGACVPGALGSGHGVFSVGNREIPILGDEHAVVTALFATGADVVAVTATEHLGSAGMKRLAWDIEPYEVDLVVAPGVADAAETRLSLQPVGELPLLHVGRPAYHGATRFTKTAFDMIFACVALVALSPILAIIAVAVKLDSPGRVLYRSERIGLDGKAFQMIKFRTMVEGADTKIAQLIASNESEGGVLFKMRHDPRVTRIGYYLRKFSLDELPQFVNVVRREMSVVGPRPPLRREVETYDGEVRRRLLVRPGVTGLWQVSGRSDLSWDESVRLDLSYVENWSMSLDLLIIAKTLRAVLGSDGAY